MGGPGKGGARECSGAYCGEGGTKERGESWEYAREILGFSREGRGGKWRKVCVCSWSSEGEVPPRLGREDASKEGRKEASLRRQNERLEKPIT